MAGEDKAVAEALSVLRNQYFGEALVNLLSKKTPKDVIKRRKIRGGGYFEYAPLWWVQDQLNALFGYMWDFEVVDKDVDLDNSQVWVLGKLTVKFVHDGVLYTVSKSNFGGGEIKGYAQDDPRGGYSAGDIIDLADDLKSAIADCIRKCASMLGMMSDLYSRDTEKALGPNEAELKALKKKVELKGYDLEKLCSDQFDTKPEDLSREQYIKLMRMMTVAKVPVKK